MWHQSCGGEGGERIARKKSSPSSVGKSTQDGSENGIKEDACSLIYSAINRNGSYFFAPSLDLPPFLNMGMLWSGPVVKFGM